MSVYVDPMLQHGGSPAFRWTSSCHMYADRLEELHVMADAIGMKRQWFQNKPSFPHYDLVARRRAMAIKLGAVEVSRYHVVNYSRHLRGLPPIPCRD